MKKIFLFLSAVFLISTLSYASGGVKDFTDNHINGRFWNSMEFTEKLYYLYGVIDGINVISKSKATFDRAHNINPELSENILRGTGRFFTPKGTYQQIIEYIDTFYSDSSNLTVPVYMAYAAYLGEQKEWSAIE